LSLDESKGVPQGKIPQAALHQQRLLPRPKERRKPIERPADLKRVASRLGLDIDLVQSLKALFDKFDSSKRSVLERTTFIEMIRTLTCDTSKATELLVEE
jgi:hypothetical protein